MTQYNTRLRPASIDPPIRVHGRSLSARKIRLSGISRASSIGSGPIRTHSELATAGKQIRGRSGEKISGNARRKDDFFSCRGFGVGFHVERSRSCVRMYDYFAFIRV